jgi:hypothetical protein
MSASEKLRALNLALQTDMPLNYGRVASLNTLGDALPQIVAVVKAAEKLSRHGEALAEQGIIGNPFGGLTLTLTALEEALS